MSTNINAEREDISPEGISRTAVLGLRASMRRSAHRLKAMAAFLAVTIHAIIKLNVYQSRF